MIVVLVKERATKSEVIKTVAEALICLIDEAVIEDFEIYGTAIEEFEEEVKGREI